MALVLTLHVKVLINVQIYRIIYTFKANFEIFLIFLIFMLIILFAVWNIQNYFHDGINNISTNYLVI